MNTNQEIDYYMEEIEVREEFIKNNELSKLSVEAIWEIDFFKLMIKTVLSENIIH